MKKVVFNWSGGKDSSLCLYKLLQDNRFEVCNLLCSVSKDHNRVSMHGVRKQLLQLQTEKIGIPLDCLMLPGQITMEQYDDLYLEFLGDYCKREIIYSVFGDIFLQDLRNYREAMLDKINMKSLFPLWGIPTQQLSRDFIKLGFKAVITCVDGNKLDASFVGREYDDSFLEDIPDEVDPCGEYGEFHTFVYDGPLFKKPIRLEKGQIVERIYNQSDLSCNFSNHYTSEQCSAHWFIDLLPKE